MTIKDDPRNNQIRAAREFREAIRNAGTLRVRNGLDERNKFDPELTKMMTRCPSFPKVIRELSMIPTKEDLNKFKDRVLELP